MKTENLLFSIYENIETQKGEYASIIVQGIFLPERLEKILEEIEKANFRYINEGKYNYRRVLYVHPFNARKPYLDKYKIKINQIKT